MLLRSSVREQIQEVAAPHRRIGTRQLHPVIDAGVHGLKGFGARVVARRALHFDVVLIDRLATLPHTIRPELADRVLGEELDELLEVIVIEVL